MWKKSRASLKRIQPFGNRTFCILTKAMTWLNFEAILSLSEIMINKKSMHKIQRCAMASVILNPLIAALTVQAKTFVSSDTLCSCLVNVKQIAPMLHNPLKLMSNEAEYLNTREFSTNEKSELRIV